MLIGFGLNIAAILLINFDYLNTLHTCEGTSCPEAASCKLLLNGHASSCYLTCFDVYKPGTHPKSEKNIYRIIVGISYRFHSTGGCPRRKGPGRSFQVMEVNKSQNFEL